MWWWRKGKNRLEERGAAWWRETVDDLCEKELRGGGEGSWWRDYRFKVVTGRSGFFCGLLVKATMGRGFGWCEKGNRCCDLVIEGL